MTTQNLWQRASAINARAHQGQWRKDGVTPYASHPVRVAFTCAVLFNCTDETVLAAALLHDVIEDTDIDYDEIAEEFGVTVADVVAALSKDERLPEAEREPAYDRQLAEAPWQARMVKLADVYDNLTECEGDQAKIKQLAKVERALKLADNEKQLEPACDIVRELAHRVQATLH